MTVYAQATMIRTLILYRTCLQLLGWGTDVKVPGTFTRNADVGGFKAQLINKLRSIGFDIKDMAAEGE